MIPPGPVPPDQPFAKVMIYFRAGFVTIPGLRIIQ